MFIQDIKRGVPIVITFKDETEISAEFDGSIDHKRFYVKSKDIAVGINNYIDVEAEFKYYDGGVFYVFTGKFLGKNNLAGYSDMVVDVIAITPLEEIPRRNDIRMSISVKIKIYEFVGNRANAFLGSYIDEGISDNISKNGIRVWSNYELIQSEMPMYTLEIKLPYGDVYYIPSKLIYSQRNMITRTYMFDYGFSFDFTHLPDAQERLIQDVLESKMRLGI